MQPLNYERYYDKIRGGWVGKCAGGILGAPIEGFKRFNDIALSEKLFENNFPNDDLDLQILWLDMALKKGSLLTPRDFSEHWNKHVDFPWNEYGVATRNIKLGLHNPDSGSHNNDYWNQSMGSPIRSELWGMLCPGQPERAAAYAKMDSTVDHTGFSVEAEQYLSACASLAFFEDDILTILEKGLSYIDRNELCHQMITQVMNWNKTYDYNTVAGKIKSFYGDADFTSAPMNVAFTILSLLHSGKSFDSLIDALRLGHDSDCIVATAGALLGIVVGYNELPEQWKERVGNELMVSPEIVGIHCPKTITELTELTQKAGVLFTKDTSANVLSDVPEHDEHQVPDRLFLLTSRLVSYLNLEKGTSGELSIEFTNTTETQQNIRLVCTSSYLETYAKEMVVNKKQQRAVSLQLKKNHKPFPTHATTLPYKIEVWINNQSVASFDNGIPQHGSWLMLGPFIEDDPAMEPHHSAYPDHGLSGLPSAVYMNHDKVGSETEFLNPSKLKRLLDDKVIFDQDFHAVVLHPQKMNMPLGDYFYGKGERTLYLYSVVESDNQCKQWLCMGTTAQVTVWHNEKRIYQEMEIKRKWPATHFTELLLTEGKNTLLVRLDHITDDFDFEVGLKDHLEKHPHQSQWNTTLQFEVMSTLRDA